MVARAPLLLALGILGADILTKYILPPLATTNRINLPFLVAALVVVILVPGPAGRAARFSRAAVIGGALGNSLDMFWHGYIRDVFAVGGLAFNLADVAIMVGLFIWLTIQLRVVYWR